MGLSDNLSKLNYDRFQNFDLKADSLCPAIFMFQGDVYKGLQADNFSEDTLDYAQKKLRIFPGFMEYLNRWI